MEYDVIVAGGGSAGLAAAVSAARYGARTLLVERHGLLGGMASAAQIHSVCGLYRLPHGQEPPEWANSGFPKEFANRLLATGSAQGPVRLGRVHVLLQRPVGFAQTCDAYVRETPRLEVRLHSELLEVSAERAVVFCRGARAETRARVFVDATGDAVLATLRGAACEMEDARRLQRPAYVFALGGVEVERWDDERRLRLAQHLAQGVKRGELPGAALGAQLRESVMPGELFVTIDLDGGPEFDPLDGECLSRLEFEGRVVAAEVAGYLRRESDGFRSSYIAAWPARVGVRESRRVLGQYRLETGDVERGAQFPDAVAYAAWPMELRETARGARLRFPTGPEPCGIPLRALRARDDDALFVAGRCLACSHEAQASVRVIGTCLATGEAAGLAAAVQALRGSVEAGDIRAARDRFSHEYR